MHLRCSHCGQDRSVINPDYVRHYTRLKDTENQERLAKKKNLDPGWKADGILRENLRKGLDRYEGDHKRDFQQPFLSSGERNPEFIKNYGESIYNELPV